MGLKYEDLEELCETLGHKVAETNDKIRMGNGDINGGDLSYIDALTHALKSVKTTMAMMDAEGGYSRDGYSRDYGYMPSARKYIGYSNARGRYDRRDSMGRYSRGADEMIEQVRDLMDKAPDEQTRHDLQRILERIDK